MESNTSRLNNFQFKLSVSIKYQYSYETVAMYFTRHRNTSLIEIEKTEATEMNENSKRVTSWLSVGRVLVLVRLFTRLVILREYSGIAE